MVDVRWRSQEAVWTVTTAVLCHLLPDVVIFVAVAAFSGAT